MSETRAFSNPTRKCGEMEDVRRGPSRRVTGLHRRCMLSRRESHTLAIYDLYSNFNASLTNNCEKSKNELLQQFDFQYKNYFGFIL